MNARRLGTVTCNRDFLISTSFMNPNGQMVVVVMNLLTKKPYTIFRIEGQSAGKITRKFYTNYSYLIVFRRSAS